MQYKSCAEARGMGGLRLVLAVGLPNAWAEAAKALFALRGVGYVPVARVGLDEDKELQDWTGHQNVPVAMHEDEKPRSSWIEILYLAERLGSGPSLLPDALEAQTDCIGLSHQICGENGLGWNRRLDMYRLMLGRVDGDPAATGIPARLFRDYAINSDTIAIGTGRLIALLEMLDARVKRQHAAGSDYLVGDRLTAADVFFATIFGTVDPLPHAVNPMPPFLRELYESGEPEVRGAVTGDLRAHRDLIYERHLTLPMTF